MRQPQDVDDPCPGPEEPVSVDSLKPKAAEYEKQELEQHRGLLHAIVKAQSAFIAGADAQSVFQQLLDALVQATSSELGFIGEVLYGPGSEPYEKTYAVAKAGRDGEIQQFQEGTSPVGAEFRNLKTLYGAVLTTGNIVCTNDPAGDPRRGGVPEGHPALKAFLGLPVKHGGELVGMVGLANRAGGYDEKIISFVQPLVNVCATTIEALRVASENARIQQTLRESEERFRALVENAPDAIFVQTQKRFAYLNPAAVRLFGAASNAQLLGQPVMERFHPDFHEAVEERIRLLNEGRKPVPRLEEKYLKLDGTPVDVEVSAVPISYENHNGALVFVRDITERTQAQEALFRLGQFPEENPNPVLRVADSGEMLYANSAARAWLAASGESANQPLPVAVQTMVADACRQNAAVRAEASDNRGRTFWFTAIRPPDERYVNLYGSDITERKRAEEALREANANLAALIEAAPLGILTLDREFKVRLWNRAAEAMFGWSAEEVLGGLLPIVPAEHLEEGRRLIERQFAGETLSCVELRRQHKNGKPVDVEVSTALMRDASGTIYGLMGIFNDVTERKRAEEALRQSRQKMALHVEQTPLGVIEWDRDFRVTAWNPAAEKIFGYRLEDARGRHYAFIVPESARPQVDATGSAVMEQRGGRRSTNENVTKSGEIIICEWFNTALIDQAGKTIGVASLVHDITECKRAEEKLRQTQERFEFVTTATNDVIFDHDLRTNRVWYNDAIRSLVGGPVDQVVDLSWWEDRVHPEDRPRIVPEVTTGDLFSAEYRLRRDDGSYAYVYDRAYIIRNDAGERVRIVGTMVDLTETRRTQEELRRSELKYRTLFENANVAILIFEPESETVLEANPAACKLYGFPRSQLIGMSLKKLSKDVARGERAIAELLRTGTRRNFETVEFNKDGQRIYLLANAAVIEYEGKTAILSINRDITERKQAELAIRKLSGELMRVQDEERRRLAGELHDTTAQNLSLLKMNLSLLPQQEGIGESMALADQCLQEVRTVSYLLHPPLLDELGLADALAAYIEGFTKRTGIDVRLHLPSQAPRLTRELETSLFRIAQQSLMNVHRHSGSRTARIGIAYSPSRVILVVRDYGRGMEQAVLQKALHEPSKLGVGIAGMHERARQFGGCLEITSNAHGTLVKAVLPVGEDTV